MISVRAYRADACDDNPEEEEDTPMPKNEYYESLRDYHRTDPNSSGQYFPVKNDKVIFPEAPLPENRHRVYQIGYAQYDSKQRQFIISLFTVTEGGMAIWYEKFLDELREIGMKKLDS
jgi:hypothetical protein